MKTFLPFALFTMTLLLAESQASAQTLTLASDTLVWQVDQMKDVPKDTIMEYHCQFISYGNDKVAWVQNGGGYINNFSVRSVNGSWTDVSVDGTSQFTVNGDFSGDASFTRAGSSIQIILNLQKDGNNLTPYVFIVSSVSKKPL